MKKPKKKPQYKPFRMVRIPLEVHQTVESVAQEEDRSTTIMVKHLLIEALTARKEKRLDT